MRDDVRLEAVTAKNWHAVVALELDPHQKDLVASNAYSIAESRFDRNARPRAVYAGDRVVGFLMYDVTPAVGKSRIASIYRFMIDRGNQGQGYGRAALRKAIDEIRSLPDLRKISICYLPENFAARTFYANFGFVEAGLDEDGEMIATLVL